MPRFLSMVFALVASPLAAQDFNARQQAAYDVILPQLELSLKEQGGAGMAAMAPAMAGCVVSEAKGREVRKLGNGPFGDEDVQIMNDIMARPGVQSCFIEAAGLG